GRRLVRLLIYAEVVDLHPEIQLLVFVFLEEGGLAVGGRNSRPDLGGPDHEAARADGLGWNRLHLIGDDETRGRKLVVGEFRYDDAAGPYSLTVAVHILHRDAQLVAPGTQGDGFPVNGCILRG